MTIPTALKIIFVFAATWRKFSVAQTFAGCSNCKYNLKAKIIDAETHDADGVGRRENDAYVTLYGVFNCKGGTLEGTKSQWGKTHEVTDDNTPTWNYETQVVNQASSYFKSTSCLHFTVEENDRRRHRRGSGMTNVSQVAPTNASGAATPAAAAVLRSRRDDYLFTMLITMPNSVYVGENAHRSNYPPAYPRGYTDQSWSTGAYGKYGNYGNVNSVRHGDGELLRYQLQLWASNCDAGYGNADRTWCRVCQSNSYKATSGDQACSTRSGCDAGAYWKGASTTAQGTCTQCPSGHYSSGANVLKCDACPTFRACTAAQYEVGSCGGSTSNKQCVTRSGCNAGAYWKGASTTAQGTCTLCPSGHYSTGANVLKCDTCPTFRGCTAAQYEVGSCGGSTSNKECKECDLASCSDGQYRSGICDDDGNGFACNACANLQCSAEQHQYRAGSCGGLTSPTVNAYTCDEHQPCPQDTRYMPSDATQRTCAPCPAGQHQPLAEHREPECMDTTTSTTATTTTTATSTTTTSTATTTTATTTTTGTSTTSTTTRTTSTTTATSATTTTTTYTGSTTVSTTTSSATTTTPNITDVAADQSKAKTKSTTTAVVVVVVLFLLVVVLLLLYCFKKEKPEAQALRSHLPVALENPQYSAAQEGDDGTPTARSGRATGDGARDSANTATQGDGYLDIARDDDDAHNDADMVLDKAGHAGDSALQTNSVAPGGDGGAAASNEQREDGANSNTLLYAVPMVEEEGDVGTFDLPQGAPGTVVAVAASGAYEVVAATDDLYSAAAAGTAVIPTVTYAVPADGDSNSGGGGSAVYATVPGVGTSNASNIYHHANHSSTASGGSSGYDHIQRGDGENATVYAVPMALEDEACYAVPDNADGYAVLGDRTGNGSGPVVPARSAADDYSSYTFVVSGGHSGQNDATYAVPFEEESLNAGTSELVAEDFC